MRIPSFFRRRKAVEDSAPLKEDNSKNEVVITLSDLIFNEENKESRKKFIEEEMNRTRAYRLAVFGSSAINDDAFGLKGPTLRGECVSDQLRMPSYPPEVLRVASQHRLISLIVNTVANEASREMPAIELFFTDDDKNERFKDELTNVRQMMEFILNEENVLSKINSFVRASKIFGSVFILKRPKDKPKPGYWAKPFNVENVMGYNDIVFKLMDPEDYTAYFGKLPNNYIYGTDDVYGEPEYWNLMIAGKMETVHKSHIIRVVEEPVSRDEIYRFRHGGLSLVGKLIPLSRTLDLLEDLRVHLIRLKGTTFFKVPKYMFENVMRSKCQDMDIYGEEFSSNKVSLNEVIGPLTKMIVNSRNSFNVVGLVEGQEVDNFVISLDGLKENIDTYYHRFAALSSVAVSALGLTPPRGLNDSGAVEADGSRRAVEANQNIIVRPIMNDMIKVFVQQAINRLGYRNDFLAGGLQITTSFKAANAVTATERAENTKKYVEVADLCINSGIMNESEAVLFLQKVSDALFDHVSGDKSENDDPDEDREEVEKFKRLLEGDRSEVNEEENGEKAQG